MGSNKSKSVKTFIFQTSPHVHCALTTLDPQSYAVGRTVWHKKYPVGQRASCLIIISILIKPSYPCLTKNTSNARILQSNAWFGKASGKSLYSRKKWSLKRHYVYLISRFRLIPWHWKISHIQFSEKNQILTLCGSTWQAFRKPSCCSEYYLRWMHSLQLVHYCINNDFEIGMVMCFQGHSRRSNMAKSLLFS